ncbi:hypothetical protein [Streptomyces sp. NPDC006334]|uniref:hypothetical protein n=1 Tax=Streptomyces sp. NPDC006334 TaxID=3156754 RepID=UPI0033B69B90
MSDELFPGSIEVQFVDAAGDRWSLIDKSSIFAPSTELTAGSVYPVKVRVVTVSTSPDGVTTLEGRDTFT